MIEIRNINAGRPTLEPYMSCCMKEIITPGASAATPDPQSVLCALEVASSASTSSSSDSDRPPRASLDGLLAQFGARDATAGLSGSDRSFSGQSTSSGASMAMSSHQEPVSHTVPLRALLEGNSDLHNMSMQLSGAPGEDLKTWHAVVRRAVMDYHGSAAHAWTRASRWVDDRWLALHSDGSTSGVEDDDGTVLDQLWLVVA